MTAPTTTPAPAAPAAASRPGLLLGGILRSEWTKIRSLRSSVVALGLLVVLSIGFTGLFMAVTVAQWDQLDPIARLSILADPTATILGAGFQLSQLAVCVLGVLVISNEYSSGTIRTSLLAVPTRTPMLLAKAAVFSVVVFVVGEIAAFASFGVGALVVHSKVPVSFGDAGVLRAIVGAGLYVAVLGVFAVAIGAIVRHSAGAITGIIGFVLVLAPLASLLPGKVGEHVHAYLPTVAGQRIVSSRPGTDELLTPWQGFAVFCLWTMALLAVGNLLLRRRDA